MEHFHHHRNVSDNDALDWGQFRLWTGTPCQISGGIRLEIKCTVNVIQLNLPETCPRLMENLSSMKPVPGAKKVGDRCYRS